MDWNTLDWKILDRLRDRFLNGVKDGTSYWQSLDDLAHYDATYARRIGWKWDAVLAELQLRGWRPTSRSILDFGCGSGIASRRLIRAFGPPAFDELLLWDRSPLAIDYAEEAAARDFPSLSIAAATPGLLDGQAPLGLLVISHVLNELSESDLMQLRRLLLRASAILWVEPGTRETARGMQLIRDELRSTFDIVAPCTHANRCPLNTPENERHWCHFFAPPPQEIFADGNWVKFGQRAGIDLRSLPYCFMALQNRGRIGGTISAHSTDTANAPSHSPIPPLSGSGKALSRVIGRPEILKPYARLLDCSSAGVRELLIPKRKAPILYKRIDRIRTPLLASWYVQDHEILDGGVLSDPSLNRESPPEADQT